MLRQLSSFLDFKVVCTIIESGTWPCNPMPQALNDTLFLAMSMRPALGLSVQLRPKKVSDHAKLMFDIPLPSQDHSNPVVTRKSQKAQLE